MVDAALFDLDGVVRRFPRDAEWHDEVGAVAFVPGLLDQVVTGKITDEEWRAEVLRRLGQSGAAAVAAWSASSGEVNDAVLALVREVRSRTRVGLLTNGTSRLAADLDRLGIADEFDVIFNSCELGVAKPDLAIYELVCAKLGLEPASVFFVDDSPGHVDAARDAGLQAVLFVDAVLLADELRDAGVLERTLRRLSSPARAPRAGSCGLSSAGTHRTARPARRCARRAGRARRRVAPTRWRIVLLAVVLHGDGRVFFQVVVPVGILRHPHRTRARKKKRPLRTPPAGSGSVAPTSFVPVVVSSILLMASPAAILPLLVIEPFLWSSVNCLQLQQTPAFSKPQAISVIFCERSTGRSPIASWGLSHRSR